MVIQVLLVTREPRAREVALLDPPEEQELQGQQAPLAELEPQVLRVLLVDLELLGQGVEYQGLQEEQERQELQGQEMVIQVLLVTREPRAREVVFLDPLEEQERQDQQAPLAELESQALRVFLVDRGSLDKDQAMVLWDHPVCLAYLERLVPLRQVLVGQCQVSLECLVLKVTQEAQEAQELLVGLEHLGLLDSYQRPSLRRCCKPTWAMW